MTKDIGYAVAALKAGKRVKRRGWNGVGMFLFLLPAADGLPTSVIHDPALRAVIESEIGGQTFDALGSVRMFTADRKILTGWLASQSDLLADDYEVVGEADWQPDLSPWQPIETLDRTRMQFVIVCEDGAVRLQLWNPYTKRREHAGPSSRVVDEYEDCSHPSHWMPCPDAWREE